MDATFKLSELDIASKSPDTLDQDAELIADQKIDTEDVQNLAKAIREEATSNSTSPTALDSDSQGEQIKTKKKRNKIFFEDIAKERYQEYIEKLKKNAPTILLVGDSGLGKSSLVNIMFSLKVGVTDKFAGVSHGEPCTQNFETFKPTDSTPVRIVDSKGLEKQNVSQQVKEMLKYIKSKNHLSDISQQIHLVYYFVGLKRWQDQDTEYVKELNEHCGIILVMNQVDIRKDDEVKALCESITKKLPGFPIAKCGDPRDTLNWLPNPFECKDGHKRLDIDIENKKWSCKHVTTFPPIHSDDEPLDIPCGERGDDQPFGHEDLVEMSLKLLPKLLQPSFCKAQQINRKYYLQQAVTILVLATCTAAGIGAAPLPFADFFLLYALESLTITKLMATYSFPVFSLQWNTILKLNTGTIGVGGGIGYLIAQSLKIIPGVNIISETIDAVVAGTVMLVLGVSAIVVLEYSLDVPISAEELVERMETVSKCVKVLPIVKLLASGKKGQAEAMVTGEIEKHMIKLREEKQS